MVMATQTSISSPTSLNVLIVGGSLSGLMNGIALKSLGHNVRILEKYPSSVRENQAAGITAGPYVRAFLQYYDRSPQPLSLPCDGMQMTAVDGSLKRFFPFPTELTSWDALYYRLRANFDGLKSEYCPKSLPEREGEAPGEAIYDMGKQVTNVSYADGIVIIEWESNGETKQRGALNADLVIAADGMNSVVKRSMLPQCSAAPKYAGYVAWRGTVPEKDVSEETRRLFQGHLSSFAMKREYILVYHIPGPQGSLEPGSRLLNFVWYSNQFPSSLASILTNAAGQQHHRSISAGSLRPEVWAAQRAHANAVLSPPFLELINAVSKPFVQAIDDGMAPCGALLADGHILLAGEALAVLRPHTAQGVNIIARGALLLAAVGRRELSFAGYNQVLCREAAVQRWWSVTMGTYFLGGVLAALRPAGYLCIAWLWGKVSPFWAGEESRPEV